MYDSSINMVGSSFTPRDTVSMFDAAIRLPTGVRSGELYFLKVYNITGSFRIGIDDRGAVPARQAAAPAPAAWAGGGNSRDRSIPLAEGRWTDGYLAISKDEQWFSFIAIDRSYYIHFKGDTEAYIEWYDSSNNRVGIGFRLRDTSNKNGGTGYSVTPGQTYYLKVTGLGSFKIGFTNARRVTPQ